MSTTWVAELDQAAVLQSYVSNFTELSRFPSVRRDIALLISDNINVSDILQLIEKTGGELLDSTWLFDNINKKFAQADANVLILGESGTGKELFAQSIHNASRRKDQPFVAINCAAIPENLVESEFFGYSDGAFTGAIKGGKPGLFEVAHNGTIFLDEIGELPLSMQAKLLRALQEKQVRRVGSVTSIPIDVRVISATNVNLLEEIQGGDFRMDLYYRIAVLNLFLPNLNQRKDDLGLLMQHYAKKQYPALYDALEEHLASLLPLLQAYEWRGNVREFENTLERFRPFLFVTYTILHFRYVFRKCSYMRSIFSIQNVSK